MINSSLVLVPRPPPPYGIIARRGQTEVPERWNLPCFPRAAHPTRHWQGRRCEGEEGGDPAPVSASRDYIGTKLGAAQRRPPGATSSVCMVQEENSIQFGMHLGESDSIIKLPSLGLNLKLKVIGPRPSDLIRLIVGPLVGHTAAVKSENN